MWFQKQPPKYSVHKGLVSVSYVGNIQHERRVSEGLRGAFRSVLARWVRTKHPLMSPMSQV